MSDPGDENKFGGFTNNDVNADYADLDTSTDHSESADNDVSVNSDQISAPDINTDFDESNIGNFVEHNSAGSENFRLGITAFNADTYNISGTIQSTSTHIGSPEQPSSQEILSKYYHSKVKS